MDDLKMVSVAEATKVFGLSRFLIKKMIGEGLPVVRIGRRQYIPLESAKRWMKQASSLTSSGETANAM